MEKNLQSLWEHCMKNKIVCPSQNKCFVLFFYFFNFVIAQFRNDTGLPFSQGYIEINTLKQGWGLSTGLIIYMV